MIYTSGNHPSCPVCGSENTACIQYGMPVITPEILEKESRGEIVFGGCCLTNESPNWRCNVCEHEWGMTDLFMRRR